MELLPKSRHQLSLAGAEGALLEGVHRQEPCPVTCFHASFGTPPPPNFV